MTEFDCRVTGVDLVEEYIQTARILNKRAGYDGQITFELGNALELSFDDDSFDVVFSQHVTMNIEDKARLAQEVRRVLRLGGRFVLYEICAGSVSTPHFPVPWAAIRPSTSWLNLIRCARCWRKRDSRRLNGGMSPRHLWNGISNW